MGTTNYTATFIQVADDCPAQESERPPTNDKAPSVAALQYELISTNPYELTSDDVLFEVYATRHGVAEVDRPEAREQFFAKAQACLRASPLAKRYGWGIHHDSEGRVALVSVSSPEYEAIVADTSVKQLKAMRSKRAN